MASKFSVHSRNGWSNRLVPQRRQIKQRIKIITPPGKDPISLRVLRPENLPSNIKATKCHNRFTKANKHTLMLQRRQIKQRIKIITPPGKDHISLRVLRPENLPSKLQAVPRQNRLTRANKRTSH